MRTLVGIASIPERAASLERTVASLATQADEIHVSLNDYRRAPAFLGDYPNVTFSVRPAGFNGGDAEKFAAVDDWDGVVVTCDDDLLYPPDYVETLLAGLARYPGSMVGFHGGKTLGWNGSSTAASHKRIRCLGTLDMDDTDVNVLGTGALAYDATRVPVWRDLFRHANMADVHLACHARTLGIPMVALKHQEGWIQNLQDGPGIYESNKTGDGSTRDTRERRRSELEQFDWTTPPSRPRVRVSVATCERAHLLPGLLDDLEREAQWVDMNVAVYEDRSGADYGESRERVDGNGWEWHRFTRRLGKHQHWRLVSEEFKGCRHSPADWFVFLPDDIRLVRHALPRAIDTWQRLQEPTTLTLWRLRDHEGQTNWTGKLPVQHENAWEVFHVDGIHLCRRPLLEFFDYQLPALTAKRATSSGVGRAMSLRLHAARKRMYRVDASLAVPVPDEPSVMNPEAGDRAYAGVSL